MALNRALRLRKSGDFQRVRQQGRSVSSRLLLLTWAPNNLATLRIGFVISKRVSKLAVKRNSLKRLLGEAIRPVLAHLPQGWDLVLSARTQIIDTDLPMLTQEIATLLRRAHLLESTPTKGTSS